MQVQEGEGESQRDSFEGSGGAVRAGEQTEGQLPLKRNISEVPE